MTLRTVLYLRVSQDRGKRYRSVNEQEAECRVACDERDLGEVIKVLVDNDLSASEYANKTRPAFLELREIIRTGNVDVVCVWEASRISRVMSVYVEFRDLCREHGVQIYVTESDRLYDFSRHRDRRDFLDEGGDAEHESGKNSTRVLRSVNSRAQQGLPHGKLLYGYRREYDPDTGRLLRQVIHEDQAQYVQEAAKRCAAGEALYGIATDLNRRGVPAPRDRGAGWDGIQIRRMLTNRAYIAKRMLRGKETADAQWPAILDEATFWTCHNRLSDASRVNTRDMAVKHLLSGIAVCGVCGAPMRVANNRGYLTYTCWARTSNGEKSFHTARRETKVDRYVEWCLFERLSMPDVREWLASAKGDDEATRAARDELVALEERLESFYREAEDGGLSAAALRRVENKLVPQIETAKVRARPDYLPTVIDDLIQPTPEAVQAAWRPLDIVVKREVLRSLTTVRLMPVGRGNRTADPETSILVDFIGD